jgi:hypothetical protein
MILIIDVENKQIFTDEDTTPADLEKIMKKAWRKFAIYSVDDMVDMMFEEAEKPITWNPKEDTSGDFYSSLTFDKN